jgi:hypothetical protein
MFRKPRCFVFSIVLSSAVVQRPSLARAELPHDDVTVVEKFHPLDPTARRPSLALSAEASIPTFRRAGCLRSYDALFAILVTKNVGPVHPDLNAGLNLWRIDDHPRPQEFVAFALSMNIVAPIGAMVESYVFSNASPIASRDGGVLFAFSQTPRPWLVFDEGADVGFYPSTRAYSLFAGATVIPAVLWRTTGGAS